VLNSAPSITSPENPLSSPIKAANAVEIKDLTFAYTLGDVDGSTPPPVLRGITLTIQEGAWLGITGKTGSGKSTLIKILTRTVDPPAGTVFVAGADVKLWDLDVLRGFFGVCPQDSYLFSDSVKNNILYGKADIDSDVDVNAIILEAARMAALDADLAAFAQGSDTLIGERGLTLSGGQKQRAAIL